MKRKRSERVEPQPVIEAYKRGIDAVTIVKTFGLCHLGHLYTLLKRNNVTLNRKKGAPSKRDMVHIKKRYLKLKEQGWKTKDIAIELAIPLVTLYWHIKKWRNE